MSLSRMGNGNNFHFDLGDLRMEVNTYFTSPGTSGPGVYMDVYCYRIEDGEAISVNYQITKLTATSRFDPPKSAWWGQKVKREIQAKCGPAWELVRKVIEEHTDSLPPIS